MNNLLLSSPRYLITPMPDKETSDIVKSKAYSNQTRKTSVRVDMVSKDTIDKKQNAVPKSHLMSLRNKHFHSRFAEIKYWMLNA